MKEVGKIQTSYWSSGGKLTEGLVINGSLEGIQKKWFENGEIEWVHEYVNDNLYGVCVGYYENGNLDYKNDWKDNRYHGLVQWWAESGERDLIRTLKDDIHNGVYVDFNHYNYRIHE